MFVLTLFKELLRGKENRGPNLSRFCRRGAERIILIMIRPCFLVADREHASSISTRKLVMETAKLNVITAYSGSEAVETLRKFPNVDGIVIDSGVEDIPYEELIAQFKSLEPKVPVILIRNPHSDDSQLADYQVDSFQPAPLLELLCKLQPARIQAIEKRNEELAEKEKRG
jgi:DNA-binding NtrC family response regulator